MVNEHRPAFDEPKPGKEEIAKARPAGTAAQEDLINHLRESQAMLARTERFAHIGSWEWEIAEDRVRWSEELFRMFRCDPAKGAPRFANQPDLYVAEDMQRLQQAVRRCVADGTPYELDLRIIRTDGQLRNCVVRGQAETDSEGRIHRLVGSLQDITERKQIEHILQQHSHVLEHTPNAVYVSDQQGRIVYVNAAASHQTGFTRDQLIGTLAGLSRDVIGSPLWTWENHPNSMRNPGAPRSPAVSGPICEPVQPRPHA